jgi:O-acetyl-ADP-ribose deacetylase (regulator of RNase III)
MIRNSTGNLLTADVDALVNTVNTVGVAGKGIALQFRQAYPDGFSRATSLISPRRGTGVARVGSRTSSKV